MCITDFDYKSGVANPVPAGTVSPAPTKSDAHKPVLKIEDKPCNFVISEVCDQIRSPLHYSVPLK